MQPATALAVDRMEGMYLLLLLVLGATLSAGGDLPITGLANVGFRVGDLEKARQFYTGVLGYEEAFALKDTGGRVERADFKINDHQYVQIFPGLPAGENVRLTHIAIETPDIHRLRRALLARGLAPSSIARSRDGNLSFSIRDRDGNRLDFIQYLPGSLQAKTRGKHISPRRISDHLWHAGVTVADVDRAMAFYRDKLGFRETWRGGPTDTEIRWINMRMPGPRGDYIEYMLYSAPPNRQQLGSMHHICLEVSDIQAAYRKAVDHGVPDQDRFKPRVGRNNRWLMNLFDPDGSRTELMEPKPADPAQER